MSNSSSKPAQAAGVFIALSVTIGAVVGNSMGQPSLGFVVGAGIGILIAVGYWVVRR